MGGGRIITMNALSNVIIYFAFACPQYSKVYKMRLRKNISSSHFTNGFKILYYYQLLKITKFIIKTLGAIG